VRLRSLVLLLAGLGGVIALLRRRRPSEYVDVHFDDGSMIRLTKGPEARDLLDDVYAALGIVV
jgi:hypothetical protein